MKTTNPPFASVHADVQQFYARQMQLLDDGAAAAWARTFTENGLFAPPSSQVPVHGRVDLETGVRKAHETLEAEGEVRRHLLTTAAVESLPDGTLSVRSYVQVIVTRRDSEPRLFLMCVCNDVLVVEDGELLVRERYVTRDDRR